jgi:heme A synthase
MKEKTVIASGLALVILVLISFVAYIASAGTMQLEEILALGIVAVLVVFGAYVMHDRAKNVSKGLPAKDERLVNINYRAGYYGFIASIWTAVIAPALAETVFDHELEGHLVTAAVVMVGGLVFALSYLYLARKGT